MHLQSTPAISNSQGTGKKSAMFEIAGVRDSEFARNFKIFLRTDAFGHTNIYAVCLKMVTDSNKRNKEKEMTKKLF